MSSSNAWIVLITGMSGSGKTTAVQALEDEGFHCIDNLPPVLAKQAVDNSPNKRRIALVLDARAGDQLREIPQAVQTLRDSGHQVDVVFLDATDDALIRRYSETRRKHPLGATSVVESIAAERQALASMRGLATQVIDTSLLSRHDLRKLLVVKEEHSLSITLVSFGFKYGLPIEADSVFDARHLKNPFFVPELRDFTGLDKRVTDYVWQFPEAKEFFDRLHDLLRYLIPLYQREGKRYLTIAIGCTGGKHRSVTFVEALKDVLNDPPVADRVVLSVRHRDIERH